LWRTSSKGCSKIDFWQQLSKALLDFGLIQIETYSQIVRYRNSSKQNVLVVCVDARLLKKAVYVDAKIGFKMIQQYVDFGFKKSQQLYETIDVQVVARFWPCLYGMRCLLIRFGTHQGPLACRFSALWRLSCGHVGCSGSSL
jgi:hypothetical protein